MKKKRGGGTSTTTIAFPYANDNELFIRDIEASAHNVLRKANKVQCSALLVEARKLPPPKLLINGGRGGVGHGNRKSGGCGASRSLSPRRRPHGDGVGSLCKLTTTVLSSKKQVVGRIGDSAAIAQSSPSKNGSNVFVVDRDGAVGNTRLDGDDYKCDDDFYNNKSSCSTTTTPIPNLPQTVKNSNNNNCYYDLKEGGYSINKAVATVKKKATASQELLLPSVVLTRQVKKNVVTTTGVVSGDPSTRVEESSSSKMKGTQSSSVVSRQRPHSSTSPVKKKLGSKQKQEQQQHQRLYSSSHSPKRKLKTNRGGEEKERKQRYHSISCWTIDDLRMKYRSEEIGRRKCHHPEDVVIEVTTPIVKAASSTAEKEGGVLLSEEGGGRMLCMDSSTSSSSFVTTTAETTHHPHPMHKALRQQLDSEISRSLLHAAAKSRQERFTLGMHQVWVGNLSHLKEFKEEGTNQHRSTGGCKTSAAAPAILCHPAETKLSPLSLSHNVLQTLPKFVDSALGNRSRRDTNAILAGNSQIQSVNVLCAFDKAIKGYYTTPQRKMDHDGSEGGEQGFSNEKERRIVPKITNKNSHVHNYDEEEKDVKDGDVDLLRPNDAVKHVCLQRSHIYRFQMAVSSEQQKEQQRQWREHKNNNDELLSPNQLMNATAYSIQIDRWCPPPRHHKVAPADGRVGGKTIKEEPKWVIQWYNLFQKKGGAHNGSRYNSGGVHLSESTAYKFVMNSIEKKKKKTSNSIIDADDKLLHSGVFKLRQLDASGKVTNHIYCYMHFGLRRRRKRPDGDDEVPNNSNGEMRNILSVVAYPLTGNLRSIGPQKMIISVGDLLGNMGLVSPIHVLYSDVCTSEYFEYLKNQLICNGAGAFAFGPIIDPTMEMEETTTTTMTTEEQMKLLIMPQGSCTCGGDLLPLSQISSLSTLQLIHARTVACALLCLLQLNESHEEEGGRILLLKETDIVVTEEKIHDNAATGLLFHRLDPSEISRWEEGERFRRIAAAAAAQVQEDQLFLEEEKMGGGRRRVKDVMCNETIFSGISQQQDNDANNTTAAAATTSPYSHHRIFASFFVDNTRSSTNSTMAHLTTPTPCAPMTMDSITVHENKMLVPVHLPHDPRPDNRHLVMNPMPRQELNKLSLQSEVEKAYNLVEGFAPGIMVLNCLSQIEDYTFDGLLEEREAFKTGVQHRRGLKGSTLGPFIRAIGNNAITTSLSLTCLLLPPPPYAPCDKLETLSYGITHQAAVGSITRVKGRCIFHSNQRCIEQFSRKRTPKDYIYITKVRLTAGVGDASCHYVSLIHQRIRGIFRISQRRYEKDQKEVEEKRRKQENKAALDAMAIAGKAKLERNRLKLENNARLIAEKRRQEVLEGDPLAAAKLRKWRERLIGSELLETWMEWEMHKEDISGSVFYRCLNPHNQLQFSWDAPLGWGEEKEKGNNNEHHYSMAITAGRSPQSSTCSNGLCDNNSLGVDDDCEIEKTTNNNGDESTTPSSVGQLIGNNNRTSGSSGNIISELVENDKFIEGIAKRLGMISNVNRAAAVPQSNSNDEHETWHNSDETTSAAKGDGKIVTHSNSEVAVEHHDQVSDSEDEAGYDGDMPPIGLPQDYKNIVMGLHDYQGGGHLGHDDQGDGSMMTLQRFALSSGKGITERNQDGEHIHGIEWRKLGSDHAPHGLRQKIVNPQAIGEVSVSSDPLTTSKNAALKSRIVGKVDLKDVTKRDMSIPALQKSLFIRDILTENPRIFGQARMQQQEKQGSDDDPENKVNNATNLTSDLLEFSGGSQDLDLTSVDRERRRKHEMEVDQIIATEELQRRAIIACTAGNMKSLGESLDEGNLSVETTDSQGNTLLLVATQQGNKRLIKMLLRRGAKINAQNGDGYSVLHFCFQHGRKKLAEYLISKGADDTLTNSQGITYYEAGLTEDDL